MKKRINLIAGLFVSAITCLVLAIAFVLAPATNVGEFFGAYDVNAFADAGGDDTTTIYATKHNIAKNKDYMLIATAFNVNPDDYSSVGYEITINGVDQAPIESPDYYTGIEVKTSATESKTVTATDIYGAEIEHTGLIVAEIAYNPLFEYEICVFMTPNEGEKEYGSQISKDMVAPELDDSAETTAYRLEAENAVIDYNNALTGSNAWKNEYSDVNNLAFDFRLSNGFATRNLNNTTGTSITFNYTSDKTATVKTKLMISVWDDKRCPFTVGNYIAMTANGNVAGTAVSSKVDLSATVIEWEDTQILVSGGEVNDLYWHFKEVEIEVVVFAGENSLVIDMIGAGGANIDYIEFNTSATISGFDNTFYMESDADDAQNVSRWYVSQYPTETTEGVMTVEKTIGGALRKYTYGLPAFKDGEGNLTKGYTIKDLGEGRQGYAFKFKNGEKVLEVEKQVVITLRDYPTVKFADGTATKTLTRATVLTTADFAPFSDGRVVLAIKAYDADGDFIENGNIGTWAVPDQDVSIEVSSYGRPGYTVLTPGNEQSDNCPQARAEGTSFDDNIFSAKTLQTINGGENGFAQTGTDFTYNGTIPQGAIFRVNTKVYDVLGKKIAMGVQHSFVFNFENKGENAIHVRVNQINSGANVESGDAGIELNLAPGESVTVVINISFAKGSANNNALTLFTVLSECVNMKLGMSMSVKLGG